MVADLRYGVVEKDGLVNVRNLIRREYDKQGFLEDEVAFEKLSSFLDLPTTTTFIAWQEDAVVGTVSVIGYGEKGIPMESIFAQEVTEMRQGRQIAEVGQLAVDREAVGRKDGMKIMFGLFSRVLTYAQEQAFDRLCIVVNPRHDFFYDRLGFQTFGRKELYGAVSAPAVAKYLDMEMAQNNSIIRLMHS